MNRRQAGFALSSLALSLATPGLALAQSGYPNKPLHLIVPYPPGASTDASARIVAQKLAMGLGQPVVVDNRAGASGNIGSEAVAKSAPDGYTFLLGTDATHATNSHLLANPPFDPIKDFTPLALIAMNPIVLVVHPSVPANNLSELVAWVKAHPGKGGFGSSGTGSPHHLAGELLKERTGAPLVHVAYRGGGPALNDLLGNQISLLFASAITVIPHIKTGKVKAIAVTGDKRYEGLPDVPTIAETLPGFDMPSWLAFFGPARMPEPVVKRLSGELVKVLQDPEVRKKLADSGLQVVGAGPAELAALQKREWERRGELIRKIGIKTE